MKVNVEMASLAIDQLQVKQYSITSVGLGLAYLPVDKRQLLHILRC